MKKKSKRTIAFLLSFFLVVSILPATGLTVEAAAKPKLAKKSASIVIGGTAKIKVKNAPKGAKITYKSAKKSVATVSKQGKVKGVKSGTANITVSVKKSSKTTKLTYKVTVKKPKLSKSRLSLKSGATARLSVKNKPKTAKYTWKSGNTKVAKVNKSGKVVAKAKGTATIKVKVKTAKKTYQLSCKVTVKPASGNEAADPADYTYEVIPLLAPFNQYFLVKTDNPDPWSFRFADKDSAYSESASLELEEDTFVKDDLYADVVYEDRETKRVNGGYIFSSFNTDGGEIILQTPASYDYWGDPEEWQDTSVKVTLPKLCDNIDYLIDTYAGSGTFFDKMDAIQEGFGSICLYSGSYIRGSLVKNSGFWSLARAGWIDQLFYIFSPYEREDSRYLFASAIYPFRYDSLGFPSVMAGVSGRLDGASSYEWTSGQHAYIDVTYNGETHIYGGQGEGEGQGLSEDKIMKFFTFDDNETITLEGSKKLLDDYSQVEMEDDIPRGDALTWEKICNTVGDGSWVRMTNGYAYLYRKDDENYYSADEWGTGDSIYWGGSLGYAANAWIDGRYVNNWYLYEPGVTFEDYPESSIMLTDTTVPALTYDRDYNYNSETGHYDIVYKNVQVTERTGVLKYYYDEEEKVWAASDYEIFADMAKQGLVDEKYPDMLQLTYDEVEELDVDRNTGMEPDSGYLYDGSAEPGTVYSSGQ